MSPRTTTPTPKAVVIGAGIGGLATAALLSQRGYAVTILEKNSTLGGRAMSKTVRGFRFDLGPSWYLQPEVFDHFFALFDKRTTDYYELTRLDPGYRMYFSPGDFADVVADLQKNLDYFESLEPGAAKKINEYLDMCEYAYTKSMELFVYTSFTSWKDFYRPELVGDKFSFNLFLSLDRYVSKFTQHPKIKRILEYSNVFLGGSPYMTPAVFCLISHLDFHQGVFYPQGGISKIVDALASLCKEKKVKVVTSAAVSKILVQNGRASGVLVGKKAYVADVVVSNADYPFTETQLLDAEYQTYKAAYWKKKTIAPSAFILYLGIKGKLNKIQHHNIIIGEPWDKHFDQIFKHPAWPDNPSYYVCCPSVTDPSVAPKGQTNLFILAPIAAGLDDTDAVREKFTKQLLDHFEKTTGERIKNKILYQEVRSQRDYTQIYNAFQGTALGLSHSLMQSALFRPKNKSKKVSNLYYVGQYTVPGIGMPMVLISAQNVAKRIQNEQ